MTDENKKEYEISFLLASLDSEKEVSDVLKQNGAEMINQKAPIEMPLAYQIKKHSAAYFGFYHFRVEPAAIKKINDTLILSKKVLRFLIITPPVRPNIPVVRPDRKPATQAVTNEALSEKLEEILK